MRPLIPVRRRVVPAGTGAEISYGGKLPPPNHPTPKGRMLNCGRSPAGDWGRLLGRSFRGPDQRTGYGARTVVFFRVQAELLAPHTLLKRMARIRDLGQAKSRRQARARIAAHALRSLDIAISTPV